MKGYATQYLYRNVLISYNSACCYSSDCSYLMWTTRQLIQAFSVSLLLSRLVKDCWLQWRHSTARQVTTALETGWFGEGILQLECNFYPSVLLIIIFSNLKTRDVCEFARGVMSGHFLCSFFCVASHQKKPYWLTHMHA